MARADGGDLNAGTVHRAGLGLRTKVRRHSLARIQEGQRRSAILTKSAPAKSSRSSESNRTASTSRTDPRRRDHMAWRQSRVLRV